MPGHDRQPSSSVTSRPRVSTSTGLSMMMGFWAPSSWSQSTTIRRLSTPTCGAAMPQPLFLYMVLAICLATFLSVLSDGSHSSQTWRNVGSGYVTTLSVSNAMVILYPYCQSCFSRGEYTGTAARRGLLTRQSAHQAEQKPKCSTQRTLGSKSRRYSRLSGSTSQATLTRLWARRLRITGATMRAMSASAGALIRMCHRC